MKEFFEKQFSIILDKIQNKDIKEKTIKAWVLSAEKGNWKEEDILNIPFTLLTDTKGINLIEHTIAVTLGAIGLANAMKNTYKNLPFEINYDYLYAGGLLHDVGKLTEIEKHENGYRKSRYGKCARHPISGAIIAAQVGLDEEIINIIANHSKEGDGRPKRVETILIHQSDFATFDPMVMLNKDTLIL